MLKSLPMGHKQQRGRNYSFRQTRVRYSDRTGLYDEFRRQGLEGLTLPDTGINEISNGIRLPFGKSKEREI